MQEKLNIINQPVRKRTPCPNCNSKNAFYDTSMGYDAGIWYCNDCGAPNHFIMDLV